MRKKITVSFVAAVALILTYLLLTAPRQHQPSYQGKTLRNWLDILYPPSGRPRFEVEMAEEAIRAIGPETLPWLVKWIEAEDGRLGKIFTQNIYPLLRPLGVSRYWRPAVDHNEKAIPAFQVLGKGADPAIPQLVAIVTNTTDGAHETLALEALCAIGSERAFDAVMSLEGARSMFTQQYLRDTFLIRNPSMAEYAKGKLERRGRRP